MDIRFVINPVRNEDSGPSQLFCLELVMEEPPGAETRVLIQTGYVTPQQAVQALVECLTYAPPPPPDMAVYDDTVGAVNGLVDRATELEDAMTQVGTRLNAVEAIVEQMTPAPPARQGLLPGRLNPPPPGAGYTPNNSTPPNAPPIRRPLNPHMITGGVRGKYKTEE